MLQTKTPLEQSIGSVRFAFSLNTGMFFPSNIQISTTIELVYITLVAQSFLLLKGPITYTSSDREENVFKLSTTRLYLVLKNVQLL
jgi:hypothetical protein